MQDHNVNQIPTNSEQKKIWNTYQSTGTVPSQMKTPTLTHDMEDLLKMSDRLTYH